MCAPVLAPRSRGAAAPAAARPGGDTALLARLRAGDERAFDELVRTHGGRMLATAQRLLRDEDAARDAVQDAFLCAFRALPGFAGESLLSTWLHRIVVNAALMKLRTRRRRPEVSIDDLLPTFDSTGHRIDEPAAPHTEGDGALVRAELRIAVRACIDRLPESYRTVLVHRDIEELDTDETSRQLGLSREVVKTRLHRARQALKTLASAKGWAHGADPRRGVGSMVDAVASAG